MSRWVRSRAEGVSSGRRHIAVAIVIAALSIGLVACGTQTQAASGNYFPVIRAPVVDGSPTPGPLIYTVGTWPSNSSPLPTDLVTIYVSFRNEGKPVAGAQAFVQVGDIQTLGPRATDSNGYAAFTAFFAGAQPGRPVTVTARVSYHGQTYENTTTFTPIPHSSQVTPTPTPSD